MELAGGSGMKSIEGAGMESGTGTSSGSGQSMESMVKRAGGSDRGAPAPS